MSNNVIPLWAHQSFDDDVTEVLDIVNPTPPQGIPFSALLAGPVSDPDAHQVPVRHPRGFVLPFWTHALTYVLGIVQTAALFRYLS